MAISELTAFEEAYEVLQPLGEAGRRRALLWLSDALGGGKTLAAGAAVSNGAPVDAPADAPAMPARRGRRAGTRAATVAKSAAAGRGQGRGRGRAVAAAAAGKRIRRQMPSDRQVMAAYQKAGSINGIAEHFKVPNYTAYSWARTLRSRGYDIGRAS